MSKYSLEDEKILYHQAIITAKSRKRLKKRTIIKRLVSIHHEAFEQAPCDLFFFSLLGLRWFGRKLISQEFLTGKIDSCKCCQITADMLLGAVCHEQITENGILIYYYPLHSAEKLHLFHKLKKNLTTDIVHPYPHLGGIYKKEITYSQSYWDIENQTQINRFDATEKCLREYTIRFLKKFNLTNRIIYDPACSTGKFLGDIKCAYPKAFTIGQDKNATMVEYARQHVDSVYEGDALESPLLDNSVDFIFIRFLNHTIVTTQQALELFCKIANRCKNNGYIILFGHTHVLLNSSFFIALGLEVVQTTAYDKGRNCIFQFYILKKHHPIETTVTESIYGSHLQFSSFFKNSSKLIIQDVTPSLYEHPKI